MPDSTFNFLGLTLSASRDGDRVTGEVRFPHETYGRGGVLIDYRSIRPINPPTSAPSSLRGSVASSLSARESFRLACARRFLELRAGDDALSQREAARRVVESAAQRVSIRSVMLWGEKLLTQGESSLADGYVPQPQTVETFTADEAEQGVKITAWWCWRIGNVERIDNKALHTAVGLVRKKFPLADLLAAIDCYYSWPCDRQRYPFKSFTRWAKYDVQTWLFRAADQADYRRQSAALRASEVPLQPPASATCLRASVPSCPPAPKVRRREVLHRGTRRAIAALSQGTDLHSSAPSCLRASVPPCLPVVASTAKSLRRLGADNAARQIMADVPVDGPPPLAAIRDPQTVAESLGLLDDGLRRMLLEVARGDRDAERQAVATMPLWWEMLPRGLRESIEAAVKEWLDLNPRWRRAARAEQLEDALDLLVRKRRLEMLRPHLRPDRSGIQRIGVALRLSG